MARMKHPWLKLFTGDILADEQLKSCSLAARGFFLYLLSLMHRSVRRGYLCQANGQPWTLDQLARMTGCSTQEAAHLTQELLTAGVFSATDEQNGRIIYSRRMVREADLSEKRADAGRKGAQAANLPRQKAQQTGGKGCDKQGGKRLGSDSECESSFSSSDQRGPPVGGVGEVAAAKSQQNPHDEEAEVIRLAQKATFKRGRGTDPGEIGRWRTHLAALVKDGMAVSEIEAELDRPDRRISEAPWDFEKRLMPSITKISAEQSRQHRVDEFEAGLVKELKEGTGHG
jgi:hypothetical protein